MNRKKIELLFFFFVISVITVICVLFGGNSSKLQASVAPSNGDRIHFLNTYFSDSILIESNGHYGLIDGGFKSGSGVNSYLSEVLGDKKLDFVIGTHPDGDHYGGLLNIKNFVDSNTTFYFAEYRKCDSGLCECSNYQNVLNLMKNQGAKLVELGSYKSGSVYKNRIYEVTDVQNDSTNCVNLTKTTAANQNYEFTFQNFKVKILNSERDLKNVYGSPTSNSNRNSLIQLVTHIKSGKKVLLTGDIERDDELRFACTTAASNAGECRSDTIGKVDILKMAHHGSSTSNSIEFLKILQPKDAIFTAGKADYDEYSPAIESYRYLVNTYNTNMYITSYDDYESINLADQEDNKKSILVTFSNSGYTISPSASGINISKALLKFVITPGTTANPNWEKIQLNKSVGWFYLENNLTKKGFNLVNRYRSASSSTVSKACYFFDSKNGVMRKGIYYYDKKLYYSKDSTDLDSGIRMTGQVTVYDQTLNLKDCSTCDGSCGYIIGNNKWIKNGNSEWYYLVDNTPLIGLNKIDNNWYFFGKNYWNAGKMLTGLVHDSGKYYYFAANGKMQTGWKKVDDYWYYFSTDGPALTNWQLINGYWYYFETNGKMVTEWKKIDSGWYYFEENGHVVFGWKKIEDDWYYFSRSKDAEYEKGQMVTGWQHLKSSNDTSSDMYWYYFNASGKMQIGWLKYEDNWYYLDANGRMVSNECRVIDNKNYCFDSSGKMINMVNKPTSSYCNSITYNGSSQTLTKNPATGYIFKNNTGTNAGTYVITAVLTDDYRWSDNTTGSVSFSCSIASKSIANVSITTEEQIYTGSAITPLPVVKDGTRTLVKDTDYTISYSNNIEVGTANITITGKGNYKGTATSTFDIIDNPDYLVERPTSSYCKNIIYNGSQQVLTNEPGEGFTFTNNTAILVGTHTIVAKLKPNYKWNDKTTNDSAFDCTISPKNISGVTITVDNQIFDGTTKTPTPVVKDGTRLLILDMDYTVESYSNNKNIGTASINIKGKGNYTGTKTGTFEILENPDYVVDIPTDYYCKTITYNGEVQTLTKNPGVGYTFTNNTGTNAGSYEVSATLSENYKWSDGSVDIISFYCTINPKKTSSLSVSVDDQVFTGSALTPLPVVKDGTKVLTRNTDYTVSYLNNKNVGTATVKVKGKGNYTGTKSTTFEILDNPDFIMEKPDTSYCKNITYNNDQQVLTNEPEVGYTFANNTGLNAGSYTITAKLKQNYKWSDNSTTDSTFNCSINPKNISDVAITVDDQMFDETAKTPIPVVVDAAKLLILDTDYIVESYSNNINIGIANVNIKGKGNYTGTTGATFNIVENPDYIIEKPDTSYCNNAIYNKESQIITNNPGTGFTFINNTGTSVGTYTVTSKLNQYYKWSDNTTEDISFNCSINPKNIGELSISVDNQIFIGSEITPLPEILDDSYLLVKDTDYTVTYSDNINVGTANISINGIGNYVGNMNLTFEILENPDLIVDKPTNAYCNSLTYNGEQQVLTTEPGEGYAFSNNKETNAGTYKVKAVLKSNYKWSDNTVTNVTFKCSIGQKSINTASVSVDDQTFSGSALTPLPVVQDGTKVLTKDTDYTVTYSDNINVGTATITVTGKGNYKGTIISTFNILENPDYIIEKPDITYCKNITYNGKKQILTNDPGVGYTFTNNTGTNAGSYTITATLNENYKWSDLTTDDITFNCSVNQKNIDNISISVENQIYTGSAITPLPVVQDGSKVLIKDTDYTIDYSNNINVGTATITLTGKGNYTGIKIGTFNIVDNPDYVVEKPNDSYCKDLIYNGELQTLTYNPSNGYTFTNNDGINAGSYEVTAKLKQNYKWSDSTTEDVTFSCLISPKDISNVDITLENQEYDGTAKTPVPIVQDGSIVLNPNIDYIIKSYINNINVGIATVKIIGNGNYAGTAIGSFEIVAPETAFYIIDSSYMKLENNNIYTSLKVGISSIKKSTLMSNIRTTNPWKLYDKNDNEITNDNSLITTGSYLKYNDIIYKIVVYGDIDKDGSVTIKDLYQSYLLYKNKASLDEYQILAADYNKDGLTNIKDLYEIYKKMKDK